MKNGYFFLLILLGSIIGCHKADSVVPAPDGLYQRWKAGNSDLYIRFLREGIVLYGRDGKSISCCSGPGYFRREDSVLVFKDVVPKPLPFELPVATDCAYVLCGRVELRDWHIISLTADRLVLNTGYGDNQTYIAAP